MEKLSERTQAVLLITARFPGDRDAGARPLGTAEWSRFAAWLQKEHRSPEDLLGDGVGELLSGWVDRTITIERVESLVTRGHALALAVDKWLRAGLWILTRSDPEYPARLKKRLKTSAPPVLFGCGSKPRLQDGGLAVVGSRSVGPDDLEFSTWLGTVAADKGFTIVSGGARGTDLAAMSGALECEGTAVGVLADSLLRASTSKRFRAYIMSKDLTLVSPFNPEAGFNAGNAMQRNKLIYCLADGAVVVHSGQKGGTWTGAIENLRNAWVPLHVKPTEDPEAGNTGIVSQGASWLTSERKEINVQRLVTRWDGGVAEADLFSGSTGESVAREPGPVPIVECKGGALESPGDSDMNELVHKLSMYDVFLTKVVVLCGESPRTSDEIANDLGIKKAQANEWLKQAVGEDRLEKLRAPVRYQPREQLQMPLEDG